MAQETLLSGSWKVFLPIAVRTLCESLDGLVFDVSGVLATGDHPIPEKRIFDKFSFRLLTDLARTGAGNVIGFHPEGTRNKSDDPYSFLRAQPGVGKLIMDAKPQVIPVFIAGLCNSLPRQIARNWNREEVIRIYFGPRLNLTEQLNKADRLRTHKEIADFVMHKIGELAEIDRSARAKA